MDGTSVKKTVLIKYILLLIGILFNFAGYLSLINLQSSINIEGGVGTASLTATYATAAIFGIVATPVLLQNLNGKYVIILCEFTYLIYILMNYYPSFFTLIPGGMIAGIGEATVWPVMLMFCVSYARSYAKLEGKHPESRVIEFRGILFLVFQSSWVLGNLCNYGILIIGTSSVSQETNPNSTSPPPEVKRDLSICGKNDCQSPNVTNNNINNYVPSQTLLYILIGVMASMVIAAMLIHACFVEAVASAIQSVEEKEGIKENNRQRVIQSIKSRIKAMVLHLINPKQLLITPFAFYCGFLASFGFSEATRAFGSCMLGVQQVGLLAAIMGGADATMSYVSSRVTKRFGRTGTLIMGFCLDVGNYMICLFWIPTESNLWVVYVIFVMIGLADGTWQPWVNGIHGIYFPNEEELAFTSWNVYAIIGIAWQTGWSSSLCIFEKIYFQLGWLCFSILCYGIAERFFHGKNIKRSCEDAVVISTKL